MVSAAAARVFTDSCSRSEAGHSTQQQQQPLLRLIAARPSTTRAVSLTLCDAVRVTPSLWPSVAALFRSMIVDPPCEGVGLVLVSLTVESLPR